MERLRILAIDPGPKESGYVVISQTYHVINSAKIPNDILHALIDDFLLTEAVLEEAVCRKWAGREVSDTAFQAGRFHYQLCDKLDGDVTLLNRSKVRWHITGVRKSNDSKVIDSIIKRFQPSAWAEDERGELSRPSMLKIARANNLRGFTKDVWQAYALAVTYLDLKRGKDA